jgi:flagellar biosynthesis/type III secretory pathway protein FliH
MDGFGHLPRMGVLFTEDFDAVAAAPPEPEVIEPVFSIAELTAAREAAWQEGHDAGLRAATESEAAVTRQTLTAIAEQFAAERAAAAERAEQAAEAIASMLLDSLAAAFPTLCARYGDAEVRAIVRIVLPALTQEAAITVRAHPNTARAVSQEIARLDPDLAALVHLVECDAMSPGDVRIAWRNGSAVRDATALWQQVAAVLMPAGLLRPDVMIRETVDGG